MLVLRPDACFLVGLLVLLVGCWLPGYCVMSVH